MKIRIYLNTKYPPFLFKLKKSLLQ